MWDLAVKISKFIKQRPQFSPNFTSKFSLLKGWPSYFTPQIQTLFTLLLFQNIERIFKLWLTTIFQYYYQNFSKTSPSRKWVSAPAPAHWHMQTTHVHFPIFTDFCTNGSKKVRISVAHPFIYYKTITINLVLLKNMFLLVSRNVQPHKVGD